MLRSFPADIKRWSSGKVRLPVDLQIQLGGITAQAINCNDSVKPHVPPARCKVLSR